MSKRQNCWEFLNCGREPGGAKVGENGVCPAALALSVNRVHGGRNGGRCCWAITGTFCKDKTQGMYAFKQDSCEKCGFYKQVHREEEEIIPPRTIIAKMDGK